VANIVIDKKADRPDSVWPIVGRKDHDAPSVFRPEALLREARRQRQLPAIAVPAICMLDPDGDVARHLKRNGAGRTHQGWACYHTELLAFYLDGIGEVGIVGCAVGAPFAVLVAEQLFASGCRLLVSVTSAGQINAIGPGYFITEMTQVLADNPKFDAWVKNRTPARRWGKPEELVGSAVFLSAAASDFVNGQIIYIDGGMISVL